METVIDATLEVEVASENPVRVVWHLAWPAVALNSMQVVNTLLDRGFIGHLRTAALTAHGGATNIMFLMFSLAVSVATGATALVSRSYGAGVKRDMRMAARQSLNVAFVVGIAISILTAAIAGLTSEWLMPPEAHEAKMEMTRFLIAYATGLPGIFVIQALAGSLRGIGDTRSPMVISGIQILMHITLNFLLIFPVRHFGPVTIPGAGLGLVGAACALSASATASAIAYVMYVRYTKLGRLPLFKLPQLHWAMRILRIAVPAGIMSSFRVLSLTAFTLVLKHVPDAEVAIAAMSVGFAIESIMFMPAFGLAAAASALVGQCLGMKKPERAEQLGWTASLMGSLITLGLAIPIYLAAPAIAGQLLGGKLDIAHEATQLLRYLCISECLFGFAMVLIGAMQGAGDTLSPLWISLVSLWGLRVPLAVVMALPRGFALGGFLPIPFAMGLGANGAWIAMAFTQGIQGVFALAAFKHGGWKTKKV